MLRNHCVEGAWHAPTPFEQDIGILLAVVIIGFVLPVVLAAHDLMVRDRNHG